MAKDFDVVYPAKGRIALVGGLNTKFDRHEIDDDESPDCLNVIFTDKSVETRGGTARFNTFSVGSFVGDGLYVRHDNDTTQTMVAFWNGTAYAHTGTATFTTIGSAQSIWTAGVRVAAAEQENHIFFGQGTQPYKLNATDWTRHGIEVPAGPTIATAPSGTGLTGGYRYKVSYLNSASAQGDVSSATATLTVANENVRVTIPTAVQSFGVAGRRIYRTEAGGTTYKLLATIADNTTTTYDDAIADAALGVAAPTDNGKPPAWSQIVYHRNRLFCNDTANPGLVNYSNLADPYVFASTNFLRVGDNSGDIVVGFQTYDTGLVVFCRNTTWFVNMPEDDETTWQQIQLIAPFGTRSPFAFYKYKNKIGHGAVENGKFVGFAALAGGSVEPDVNVGTVGALGSLLKTDRIEEDMFDVVESLQDRISAIIHKQKAYITLAKGAGSTANNRVYMFDFSVDNLFARKNKEGVWVPWDGINAEQFAEYNGDLYFISSLATGFVHKMNLSAYTDQGAAIDSYFWTKNYSGIPTDERITKDFRAFSIIFERSGGYFMNVSYRTDSNIGVGTVVPVDLDPGGALFGTAEFGVDVFGGGQEEGQIEQTLGQVRGERIQFKFDNQDTANQKFKIIGLQYIYNRKGRRRNG
jgi:hypothetical protein